MFRYSKVFIYHLLRNIDMVYEKINNNLQNTSVCPVEKIYLQPKKDYAT